MNCQRYMSTGLEKTILVLITLSKGICKEFGLAVIEYAPLDEVKDLASEANIFMWTGDCEDSSFSVLDESFVGNTSNPITMERMGPHFYTRFVLLEQKQNIRHLRICGKNCLKKSAWIILIIVLIILELFTSCSN